MEDPLFQYVLGNICPLLDDPSFAAQYTNKQVTIVSCSNGCVQVSYEGHPPVDKWFRNHQQGWCREHTKNYSVLYYGNQNLKYRPASGQKRGCIVNAEGTHVIQNQNPFIYECQSDMFMKSVYYFTGEGLHMLSNMGIFSIKEEIATGLGIGL